MSDPVPQPSSERSPDPPANEALEALLFVALERLEIDGAAGVERLLAEHPAQATQLRAHLGRLHRMGLAGDESAAVHEHPQRLGEYRIVAPLGHGGMGIVYRAVQESLGREVALKLIRPDQLFFPGARERFRREIELVARMQHPGIVPIYAIGSEAGVPYFAMELVHGAPLSDVIEVLHGRDPKTLDGQDLDRALASCLGEEPSPQPAALFTGTWTVVILRIVREVADALEHAHRRGVLHRDVKPSNIMLTREGRVLLLDFGLAGGTGSERLTRTGSPLGSIAYMAPELLSGEATPTDLRCDVYSLGATCWELLALRLPYQSSDPILLRDLARAAGRPKLSSFDPAVTWDVETVVATAMEPDPARRYASASLLSRDLDNLLAHRSIEARQPGVGLRLKRWTQRHPARATAVLALTFALIGGPGLWAWEEGRARERIQEQRDELAHTNIRLDLANTEAQAESRRARTNFAKLLEAVDTMLTKVGDEGLRDIPRMEIVREQLLTEALRFYEGFLAELPDDPAVQLEAARVRLRTADVQALLGNHTAARDQVRLAIDQLTALRAKEPEVATDLARAHLRLATADRVLGDLPGAQLAATAAIADWQALAGELGAAAGLGEARIEAGLTAVDRGDLKAGLDAVETSLLDIEAWHGSHPADLDLDHLEARTLDWAAVWSVQAAMQSRDRAQAVPQLEHAVDLHTRARKLWEAVVTGHPNDTQARADAGQNLISLAIALQTLGRTTEARPAIEAGVDRCAALVADFPAAQRRRAELANARANFAAVLGQLGAFDDSVKQSIAARELWAGLVLASPHNDAYQIGLSQALQSEALGKWYSGTPPTELLPTLGAAEDAADEALAIRPDNPSYRRTCRVVIQTGAEVCLAAGDHGRTAAAAHRLLEERLAPPAPAVAAALLARAAPLAAADLNLAESARATTAKAYHDEARRLLEAVLQGGSSVAKLHGNPMLADQWDKPGFVELCRELEQEGH